MNCISLQGAFIKPFPKWPRNPASFLTFTPQYSLFEKQVIYGQRLLTELTAPAFASPATPTAALGWDPPPPCIEPQYLDRGRETS